MSHPRVSIVIPVYNRAPLIGHALTSVLCQTFQDFEVVVVDDGSTDDIEEAIGKHRDPRLRLVRHEINRGAAAARNTGVQAARGTYVAFLDSDDEWLSNKLSVQVAALETANPRVAGAVSGFLVDRGRLEPVQAVALTPHNDLFFRLLWGCNLSPGTTLICRRNCFDHVGFFDEHMRRLEDWDWLLRFAQSYDLHIVREPLAILHVGNSPSSTLVAQGLATIAERYQRVAESHSRTGGRVFRSSLQLEHAAIAFREGRSRQAIELVSKSLVSYPARDTRFFLRMLYLLLLGLVRRAPPQATPRFGRAKVLHVITTLQTGGAENMLVQLASHDQAAGRKQNVATLIDGGFNATRLTHAGVPVVGLGLNTLLDVPKAVLRLTRLIRREQPEVTLGWMYHANAILTAALYLSGRRRQTRLIWGLRNSEMDFRLYRKRLGLTARLGGQLSGLPDAVVANSQAGFTFHWNLGYRPQRFYVVDNGVDIARFPLDPALRSEVRRELGIPEDICVAIMVARVDPMKDHGTLLAATRELTGMLVLTVGFRTDTLPDTEGLMKLGERQDVPRLLAASDVLVLSSKFGEGIPNAVLEGMAAGLAIVATDTGDVRRILGSAGLVVPPSDPEALAAAMRTLRDDPDLRRRYGAQARERAEREFSLSRAVETFGLAMDSAGWPDSRWSIVPLTPASFPEGTRESIP